MFGIKTEEQGLEVMATYSAWDKYMGHIWYNLLHFCNLQEECTVIEFAGGNSVKIADALQKTNFRGKLYLVDPCQTVLEKLLEKYAQFIPHAKIYPVCSRLSDSLNALPHKPDFLIANHALDDLLLSKALGNKASEDFFSWSLNDEEIALPDLQEIWQKLENNKLQLEQNKEEVCNELILTMNKLEARCFIINQYASYVLNVNELSSLNLHAKEILFKLRNYYHDKLLDDKVIQMLLSANKNYNNLQIGHEVLNAGHWLIKNA